MAVSAPATSLETGECANDVSEQNIYVCSKEMLERADAELNEIYRRRQNDIAQSYRHDPAAGKMLLEHLKKSQRSWIPLRDENCRMESFFVDDQAPAYEVINNDCIARESRSRTDYLKGLKF
ncbi:lysozyme inhibitor LprI family protein [Pseudomonas sp. NPDC090201]|uniref:lysozyme inhibitor LprI family protein n=1 Tax=Pseudomonas sp. NPDC090201 TaxID=3364475 RepID=UPI0038273925